MYVCVLGERQELLLNHLTSAYCDTATPFPPTGRVPVIGKGSAEKFRESLCGRLEFLLVNDGCTQERGFLDISTFVTPLASIFEALRSNWQYDIRQIR